MRQADLDDALIRHELGLPRTMFTPAQVEALRANTAPGWKQRGDCLQVGWEVWFEDLKRISRPMRVLCAGCPVRRACLATAILVDERGVWAGTSYRTRAVAAQDITAGAEVDEVLDQVLTTAARRPAEDDAQSADDGRGVAA